MALFGLGTYIDVVLGLLAKAAWTLECRINRRLPTVQCDLYQEYIPQGDSLGPKSNVGQPSKVLVGITTYGRPGECTRLIDSLARSLHQAGRYDESFIAVVRDNSDHDYSPVLASLEANFSNRFVFYAGVDWQGKAGRYKTYQLLFNAMRFRQAEYALFFEDDAVIRDDCVSRALTAYENIDDEDKAVLYLAKFDDDEPDGRWVHFPRRENVATGVDQTQWFDLHGFVAGRRFFETLNWTVFRPHRYRWVGNPKRSSGVSEQFSLRLFGRANTYQVRETLVFHGQAASLLNQDARTERALNNF